MTVMTPTRTIHIPDALYKRIQQQATRVQQSVEQLIEHAVEQTLPPAINPNLPNDVQVELAAMEALSDGMLWQIAEGEINVDKVALFDFLQERRESGQLTDEGRVLLGQAVEEFDHFTLRKAHAYSLLSSRGHSLPTLEEMQARRGDVPL